MPLDFQNMGLTESVAIVILFIIVALAIIGFVKGLIRTLVGLICIAVSGYASFWGYEHSHDFTASWSTIPSIWAPKIVALITGFVALFICRYLLKFLINPFENSSAGNKIGSGFPAAALSLCAGLALIWGACTGIRYAASLSELHDLQRKLNFKKSATPAKTGSKLLFQAEQFLDHSKIGQWQKKSDPFFKEGKLTLSKLLIMYYNPDMRLEMLKDPDLNQLLNDPEFIKLAYSSDIKKYVKSKKPRDIFNAESLQNALGNPHFLKLFKEATSRKHKKNEHR